MQHSMVKWCYQKTDGYWLTHFAIKAEMVDMGDTGRCASFLCIRRFGNVTGDGPVDLVLSCVDNFEARMTINAVCFFVLIDCFMFELFLTHFQ